jgi:hypothetical protein
MGQSLSGEGQNLYRKAKTRVTPFGKSRWGRHHYKNGFDVYLVA